jgi:hypothetical protein
MAANVLIVRINPILIWEILKSLAGVSSCVIVTGKSESGTSIQ